MQGKKKLVRGYPDPLRQDRHVRQLLRHPQRLQLTAPVNRGHKHCICNPEILQRSGGEIPDSHGVVRPADVITIIIIIVVVNGLETDLPLARGSGEQRPRGMNCDAVDTVGMEEIAGQRRPLAVPDSHTAVRTSCKHRKRDSRFVINVINCKNGRPENGSRYSSLFLSIFSFSFFSFFYIIYLEP
jgi:hypothetical protein